MPEKHKRYFLRAKESKALLAKMSEKLQFDLEKVFKDKINVEAVETDFAEIFLINNEPVLIRSEGNLFPALSFKEILDSVPKVIVDMGAVPYVCKGANVMAPGIRKLEGNGKKGDFVFVVDEEHGKPIAVGEMLYDMAEAGKVGHGVVVKSIHYVGDNVWEAIKRICGKV